jgi:phenylalanyl-tRNA synthetase alpha subunit
MRVEEISTWVQDARKAFASATDLDSLKTARLAHAGDKSPIALASRGLGALSPEDKASFGKIIGEAKAEIAQALAEATAVLEAERDRKVLLEEVVDITLPVNRSHRGGLHPITQLEQCRTPFSSNLLNLEWFCELTHHLCKSAPCLHKSHRFMLSVLDEHLEPMNLMQPIVRSFTK